MVVVNSCLVWCLLGAKSYVNEENCSKWRHQRFSFIESVPLGWSGSESVIQNHSDHVASKKPMNPLWSQIHWYLLMNYDPSNFGSLILIQITPKERSQMSICMIPLCGRSPYMEHIPMQRCSSIVKFLVFCVFSQSRVVFNTSPVKA